jgi:hypothetical protein
MSTKPLTRRRFLTLPALLVLAGVGRAAADGPSRRGSYSADVGILHDLIALHLTGTMDEAVDRTTGQYSVRIAGEGPNIANRIESTGRLMNGRWAPVHMSAWFQVRGREARSEALYDHARRTIDYHFRGETFFLRRLRIVDDTVAIPASVHVDDVVSAMLNYADDHWRPDPDGQLRTHVVKRRKKEDEGPDEIEAGGHAELVPFALKLGRGPDSGRSTGQFDMTPFSSWARRSRPAQIIFGANRRPEWIKTSLMLGTSVVIHLREA